jgi:hypothetical protein
MVLNAVLLYILEVLKVRMDKMVKKVIMAQMALQEQPALKVFKDLKALKALMVIPELLVLKDHQDLVAEEVVAELEQQVHKALLVIFQDLLVLI